MSPTQKRRSARVSVGLLTWRLRMATCWRSARFSSAKSRRFLRVEHRVAATDSRMPNMAMAVSSDPHARSTSRSRSSFGKGQGLAEDDDVVEAVAANGAHEALHEGILPRRVRGGPDLFDAK